MWPGNNVPNSFRPHRSEGHSACICGLGNWKRDLQSSWACFVFYPIRCKSHLLRWGRGMTWGRMYLGSQHMMHLSTVGDVYGFCLEAGPGHCYKTNCWSSCQICVSPQLPDKWTGGKIGSCPSVGKSRCRQGRSYLVKSETSSFCYQQCGLLIGKTHKLCVFRPAALLRERLHVPSDLTASVPFLSSCPQSRDADCWSYSLYSSADVVGN